MVAITAWMNQGQDLGQLPLHWQQQGQVQMKDFMTFHTDYNVYYYLCESNFISSRYLKQNLSLLSILVYC